MSPTRKAPRKDRKPSLRPKAISKTAWWYEDKRGIDVVTEFRKGGDYMGTITNRIRWSQIIKAAKRCGQIP